MSIQSSLKDEIINEQIDVVIMGPMSAKMIEILSEISLNKDARLWTDSSSKYFTMVKNVLPFNLLSRDGIPGQKQDKDGIPGERIQKFTSSILTRSFWIQFNFFYFGELAYDPYAAQFTKGRTSMCIIANDDSSLNSS